MRNTTMIHSRMSQHHHHHHQRRMLRTVMSMMYHYAIVICFIISFNSFNNDNCIYGVNSFTFSPMTCSLREPIKQKKHKPKSAFSFNLPEMPLFFNSMTSSPTSSSRSSSAPRINKNIMKNGATATATATTAAAAATATEYESKLPPISSLAKEISIISPEEIVSNGSITSGKITSATNNTSYNNNNNNNQPEDEDEDEIVVIDKLETRGAIMEHALKVKNGELEILNRRNILLQDVVQKLQLTNRNLLDKVHQLQYQKEGMHIETNSQEVWPPEMQVEIIREEYNTKETEWQNALDNAHEKFMRLRDRYYDLVLNNEELQNQVTESTEKISYYEEKAVIDENDIAILKEQIELNGMVLDGSTDEEVEELEEGVEGEFVQEIEEDVEEVTAQLEFKVEELEATIAELEKENEDAKTYLQNMRENAEEKRQAIQKIVEEERAKKQKLEAELESSNTFKSQLQIELDQSKQRIEGLKDDIQKSIKEAEVRQKEEEERAKLFSKESLDIATAAVRQAEERELALKQQLKRTNKKMEKLKGQNEKLNNKVADLKKSIEEDMEKFSQNNMELVKLENDWKLEINQLGDQLQDVRESRDVLFQEGLRLREELNEKTKRYMTRMEASQASWDELLLTQKNDHESVVKELNDKIAILQSTIDAQNAELKASSGKIKNPEKSPVTQKESKSQASSDVEIKPKRFKVIRAQFSKVRKWFGKKLRRT